MLEVQLSCGTVTTRGWSEPSSILVQLRQPQVAGELFLEALKALRARRAEHKNPQSPRMSRRGEVREERS